MAQGDWQQRLAAWMYGRRGPDDLSIFSTNLAIVIVLVNVFVQWAPLAWIGLVLLAYAIFRTLSKNLAARSRENEAFLKALGPARPWVQNPRAAFVELRSYKHVRCTSCKQKVRVPRGKGKLRVTCPKCRTKFEVRS